MKHGYSLNVGSLLLVLALLALWPLHSSAQQGRGGIVSEGDSTSYRHILTPGDRGEWALTVRAGETVIVFVTSTTFDPAAEIVDAAGKSSGAERRCTSR